MRSITGWFTICLVILIVAYPLLFHNSNAQMQRYFITTNLIGRVPISTNSPSNSWVRIYEKASDMYGAIIQAKLFYCVSHISILLDVHCRDVKSWDNTTMRLIDGIPSNGTYLGLIPPQKDGSTVRFDSYFKDSLGYTNKYRFPYAFKVFDVKGLPESMQSNEQWSPHQLHIYTMVTDYNNQGPGEDNVTLNYAVTPALSKVIKFTEVQMKSLAVFIELCLYKSGIQNL